MVNFSWTQRGPKSKRAPVYFHQNSKFKTYLCNCGAPAGHHALRDEVEVEQELQRDGLRHVKVTAGGHHGVHGGHRRCRRLTQIGLKCQQTDQPADRAMVVHSK